jgi:hypothetical protein
MFSEPELPDFKKYCSTLFRPYGDFVKLDNAIRLKYKNKDLIFLSPNSELAIVDRLLICWTLKHYFRDYH